MRIAAIMALGLLAAGCIGGRDRGLATYDALVDAQRACAAKGGVLKQKDEGNAKRIDGFACERK